MLGALSLAAMYGAFVTLAYLVVSDAHRQRANLQQPQQEMNVRQDVPKVRKQ